MSQAQSGIISSVLLEELIRRVLEGQGGGGGGEVGDGGEVATDPALVSRVSAIEQKIDALDARVTQGFAKIEESVAAIAKTQEETVDALEKQINENTALTKTNAELILVNTKEIQRLIRENNLAPGHRIKADASEDDRRIYALPDEITTPPATLSRINERMLVRVVTDSELPAQAGFSVIVYIADDGAISKPHYISSKALEKLYP